MIAKAFRYSVTIALVSVVATGCFRIEPDPDFVGDPVVSIEQGVKTLVNSWGSTSSAFVPLSGTSTSTQTCFLSGVFGDLMPDGPAQLGGVMPDGSGGYAIYLNTSGQDLGIGVQCVSSATARTSEQSWSAGSARTRLGSAWDRPMRRCFLTRIFGSPSGSGSKAFSSNNDFVKVWSDGTDWFLGGSLSGPGGAWAQCVDVGTDYGSWVYQAPDLGAIESQLTNVDGVSCPLQYVGGHFDINGWESGVYTWLETGTNQFSMHTSNGQTGWTTCVR